METALVESQKQKDEKQETVRQLQLEVPQSLDQGNDTEAPLIVEQPEEGLPEHMNRYGGDIRKCPVASNLGDAAIQLFEEKMVEVKERAKQFRGMNIEDLLAKKPNSERENTKLPVKIETTFADLSPKPLVVNYPLEQSLISQQVELQISVPEAGTPSLNIVRNAPAKTVKNEVVTQTVETHRTHSKKDLVILTEPVLAEFTPPLLEGVPEAVVEVEKIDLTHEVHKVAQTEIINKPTREVEVTQHGVSVPVIGNSLRQDTETTQPTVPEHDTPTEIFMGTKSVQIDEDIKHEALVQEVVTGPEKKMMNPSITEGSTEIITTQSESLVVAEDAIAKELQVFVENAQITEQLVEKLQLFTEKVFQIAQDSLPELMKEFEKQIIALIPHLTSEKKQSIVKLLVERLNEGIDELDTSDLLHWMNLKGTNEYKFYTGWKSKGNDKSLIKTHSTIGRHVLNALIGELTSLKRVATAA